MDDLYREEILDHYKHPRHVGKSACSNSAHADNPLCGDDAYVYITVKNGKILNATHITRGCAISVASASMLFEKIQGMAVVDVLKLKPQDITDSLGTTLTPSRLKCALLPLETVQRALTK
ncbi:Fe-S cluster protein [Candidatus Roizmanbacteria bacterium CG10_big_fil_rev_8_21_14_0_10_39_6]|uniref:Fe-S cluster protein n=1 Tax=Candidatus Roizmanbacteria bacterium CG10_big_fil_rev_8_21_14_0_10_39_6 TaxID=1974853 RepID=A0A2M8KRH6_9BACT|nr:MAG: Fe-S cluster protein [Candidatus Roizmanbacteria bacterium CG10_big_fil_rev_8_21_14_0_10_39_6]